MTYRPALWSLAALSLLSCTPSIEEAPVQPVLAPTGPPTATTPNILLLGDSQISFGAGGPYLQFLQSLGQSCPGLPPRYATADAQAVGVRSTALHNWTAKGGPERGTICDVDPTYGVNAGSYGVTSKTLSYVQIGTPDYPYCTTATPLSAAIDHTDPDLIVLAFLGNATDRWQSAATARADWRATSAALPQGIPCVMATTIPAFYPAENQRRQNAQNNIRAAVQAEGRCSFVTGLNPSTLRAIEGRKENFRTDAAGAVTDATHPTTTSAQRYIQANRDALCSGLRTALTE